jgi:hypothetical protein
MTRLLPAALLALAGCSATTQTWSYPPEPGAERTRAAHGRPERLAVVLKADRRSSEVFDLLGWAIGPLVPCGWITYERPEAARGEHAMFPTKTAPRGVRFFVMDPARDLPAAIAEEIRASGLFADAAFEPAGGPAGAGGFTLEVVINRFAWTVYNWTYGLSVFGEIAHWLTAPYAGSRVRMDVDLVLRDPAGAAVWSGKLADDDYRVHRLYHNYGFDIRDFARPIARQMPAAIAEMDKALSARAAGPRV